MMTPKAQRRAPKETPLSWSIVTLVLSILILVFAVYFTQVVLRHRGGSLEASVGKEGVSLKLNSVERDQAAADAQAAGKQRGFTGEGEHAETVLGQVAKVRPTRCLWVDDNPDWNVHERRMLERLHVQIDLARSTEEAAQLLIGRRYDLLITDLTRGPREALDRDAGLAFLRLLAGAPMVPPVLVYAADPRDRGPQALGLGARAVTTSPSELLRASLEVLEV
jgi:CheY-like chemotaxis protein